MMMREQQIALGVVSRHPRRTVAVIIAIAAIVFQATASFSGGDRWFLRIAAIAAAVMIADIVNRKTRPTLTIKQISGSLRHKCSHLRTVPFFRDIPHDILHTMIVPMANNADFRAVQNGSHNTFMFDFATIHFGAPTASNPGGIIISPPNPVPVANMLDHFHIDLQIKSLRHINIKYYGGYLFNRSRKGKFYVFNGFNIISVKVPDAVKSVVIAGMVAVWCKHDRITFISPASLGCVTVTLSQLPKPDRKFLVSVFPKDPRE